MNNGMKFDGGKLYASLPFLDFPDAIQELIKVSTFGANKYARHSWKDVPDAAMRYEDALARHFLSQYMEDRDTESGINHKAHLAWNALATLQMEIERVRNECYDNEFITTTFGELDAYRP